MRWFLCSVLIVSAAGHSSAAPEEAATEAIVSTLRSYHEALAAGDPARVRETLGPTLFMGDSESADGSDTVRAHMFLTRAALDAWPALFLEEVGEYENAFDVVAVSEREGAAVVTTRR